MRVTIRGSWSGLYAAVVVLLCGLAGPARAATATPAEALAKLNAWRAEAGEAPVTEMVQSWNDGCAKHNAYEAAYGITHPEDSSKPEYTPEGNYAGEHSILAGGAGYVFPDSTPRVFDQAVFHRMSALAPRLRHSGWASTDNWICMRWFGQGATGSPGDADALDAAPPATVSVYPWPADAATGVATTFNAQESPDPHAAAGGDATLGYLISVNLDGPWPNFTSRTEATTATLTPDGGAPVPVQVIDGSTPTFGPFLLDGAVIIPTDPLAGGTRYTVVASGTVKWPNAAFDHSAPWSKTWSFTTGSAAAPAGPGGTTTPGAGGTTTTTPSTTATTPTRLADAFGALRGSRSGRRVTVSGTVTSVAAGDTLRISIMRGTRLKVTSRTARKGRFTLHLLAPPGSGRVVVTVKLVPRNTKKSKGTSRRLGPF